MDFFVSMEIDPTCEFSSPQSAGPKESLSKRSLHLHVFTQPRPKDGVIGRRTCG
jgi:hypothetical protein